MREFLSGLLLGLAFAVIAVSAFFGARVAGLEQGFVELALMLLPIAGGVLYRKWYGPMFRISRGIEINRIARHLFGFGLPVGALNFFAMRAEISDLSLLAQALILLLALCLSGFKVAGQYLVGSWIGEKCGYS